MTKADDFTPLAFKYLEIIPPLNSILVITSIPGVFCNYRVVGIMLAHATIGFGFFAHNNFAQRRSTPTA